jgi:GNAT superfamily N-acetyltransferase
MELRQASEADLPGAFEVFVTAQTELHDRRGAPWCGGAYDPAGPWADVHRHLLEHDARRYFVAKHNGRVIGTAAAFVRGSCWFFASLFVDPEHQGQGIGRRLLELTWDGSHTRRITITERSNRVRTASTWRTG